MNKQQAEKAGKDVIECLSKICEKESEWARNVIRATENAATEGARGIRTTATNEISQRVAYYQMHINQIHQILDAGNFKEPQKSIIAEPAFHVSEDRILNEIRKAKSSKGIKGRALNVVKDVLNKHEHGAKAVMSFGKIEWMKQQTCGISCANFIMETLADLRPPA